MFGRQNRSRGASFAAMVQTAHLWEDNLADLDAELEQFAVDAGRAPERVGQAHLMDQLTDLQRDARSPAAPPGFPAPERSKSSTVPTNHRLGPADGQCVYNARNEAIQPNEHQSIGSPE